MQPSPRTRIMRPSPSPDFDFVTRQEFLRVGESEWITKEEALARKAALDERERKAEKRAERRAEKAERRAKRQARKEAEKKERRAKRKARKESRFYLTNLYKQVVDDVGDGNHARVVRVYLTNSSTQKRVVDDLPAETTMADIVANRSGLKLPGEVRKYLCRGGGVGEDPEGKGLQVEHVEWITGQGCVGHVAFLPRGWTLARVVGGFFMCKRKSVQCIMNPLSKEICVYELVGGQSALSKRYYSFSEQVHSVFVFPTRISS